MLLSIDHNLLIYLIALAVSKVRYRVKSIYLRQLKLFEKRRVISKIKLFKKMNDSF